MIVVNSSLVSFKFFPWMDFFCDPHWEWYHSQISTEGHKNGMYDLIILLTKKRNNVIFNI